MDRARRGGSGALNPQSALAGLNSPSRGFAPVAPPFGASMVRVPRGVGLRTRSGPEGSSLKRSPTGAAGAPEPEPWTEAGARMASSRQGVHGPASLQQCSKISQERLVAASLKPGGTETAAWGSCGSSDVVGFDLGARGVDVDARFELRPTDLGSDDVFGVGFQVQREQRDRCVVGDPDRSAAQVDGVALDERDQVVFDPFLSGQFVQLAFCRAILGGARRRSARARSARPAPSRAAAVGRPAAGAVQPNAPAPQKMQSMAAARNA